MSEQQRRRYNADVKKIDELETAWLAATNGRERTSAAAEVKAAWIGFDKKWNDRTPTDEQMARWFQSLVR